MSHFLLIWIFNLMVGGSQTGSSVLKGEVVEAKTKGPVPYVNIFLKPSGTRLISNAEGKFQLLLSAKDQHDTLWFSCIGFQPLAVPVQEFLRQVKEIKRVSLQESTTSLPEVQITPITARQIIERGIASIPENYGGRNYLAEGFYRHAVKENGLFSSLIESVVKVYNTGFGNAKSVAVDYFKTRLSHDFRQYQPAVKPNLMQQALALDHVRYGRGFLNRNNVGNWQFKLTGYTQIDKQEVYIIKASLPNVRHHDVHQATIFVRAEDYAFLKIDYDYHWNSENVTGEPFQGDSIKFKKYSWQGTFSYVPYRSIMVLNYFHFTLKQKIYFQTYVTVSSGRMQTTKELASQELHEEFTVNNIRFLYKAAPVPAAGKLADLYQNAHSYDRHFWQQYQQPVDSKLYQAIKSDLEKHAPLEAQFGQARVD